MFVLPLGASVVAAAFAVGAWRAGTSPALRIWAYALGQFAIASAVLAWGVGFGWGEFGYRIYYLFGAVLNVAWLGLGTIWLLTPRWTGLVATFLVGSASAAAGALTLSEPLLPAAAAALATEAIPSGSRVMPDVVRALSRWFSITGSVAVLAGLVWSIVRRRRHALGLVLLATGVVVVGGASEFARLGFVLPFSVGLAVGVAVMYAGFLRTR